LINSAGLPWLVAPTPVVSTTSYPQLKHGPPGLPNNFLQLVKLHLKNARQQMYLKGAKSKAKKHLLWKHRHKNSRASGLTSLSHAPRIEFPELASRISTSSPPSSLNGAMKTTTHHGRKGKYKGHPKTTFLGFRVF
jgi:hypothetical protein